MPSPPNSVLARARLRTEPFPHCVVENCLDDAVYAELLRTRPGYHDIRAGREAGDNKRLDICGACLLESADLPPIWREFIEFHTSAAFWGEITSVFELGDELGKKPAGLRFRDKTEIVLDCQIGLNTPVKSPESRVRGPHVDNPVEIFGGLLYMGEPQGEGEGDLILYEPGEQILFHGKAEIHDALVREVARVPYRHNTFVGFINGPTAIHGVTPRRATDRPRWLVNIVAEQQKPGFILERARKTA